jgi:antitoxin component YwqK of YwqJK toxin-antitoxin module
VEIHYTHHTSEVISGSIVVNRLVEYASANEINYFTTHVQKDTLATFYGTIIKGKKHGTFVSAPEGNIVTVHTYRKNVKEGPFRGFYVSGQLYNEGTIKANRQTGNYTQYYANGKQSRSITRNDIDNLLVEEYFYQNGQTESKGASYRDNKVNEWVYYDFYGNLKKKEYYNNRGRLLTTTH